MDTRIAYLTADSAADNQIFACGGKILREGGLVAFPTETVYGLGANALDSTAAAKIYAAKGRPSDNPLIIHLARVEDAEKYCYTSALFYKLAAAFMPGPLTVVMKKRDCVPSTVTGGLDTVAVRVPANEWARRLIEAAGVPVAAPSANLSGKPSPTQPEHVIEDMNGRSDMIICGGSCDIGVESTIVKIDDGKMTLLRPGGVTLEMLSLIGDVELDKAIVGKLADGERPLAPGMKYRHYAPNTSVVLIDGTTSAMREYIASAAKDKNVGALLFDDELLKFADTGATLVSLGEHTPEAEAHSLFAKLREVDAYGCDVFFARLPDKKGIGLALYNRMIKAAGHSIVTL